MSTTESSPAIPAAEAVEKKGFFDSVLEPPTWLDQAYMENVFQNFHKDPKLKITKLAWATCTKPGDNFIGVMFRASVSYTIRGEQRDESVIVKIKPFLDGMKKDMVEKTSFFQTEGRVYTDILPVMQDMLKNIKDPEILAPGLIHFAMNPDILIFVDVAPEGFVMQHLPVPFPKASQVARKIAKFHALSYFIAEERGESVYESYTDSFFNQEFGMEGDINFIEEAFKSLAQLVSEWGPEMVEVQKKLEILTPGIVAKLKTIVEKQRKGSGINVLNHGDFHIRNLLFRPHSDDNQHFEAIRLIDFQIAFYGTPAYDLCYLLFMISDAECEENHRDELLTIYHKQFVETLTELGFLGTPPSLLDFQLELLKNGQIELFVVVCFVSLYHLDVQKMANVDWTDTDAMAEMNKSTFNVPAYKEVLMRVLRKLLHKGLLDV